jgi:two-component system CheB/CheR fusion protein
VRLTVKPLPQSQFKGLYMVLFEELPVEEKKERPDRKNGLKKDEAQRFEHLEDELRSTRESLQTTIEELETSNEELRSMRTILEQILPDKSSFEDFSMEHEFPGLGLRRLRLSGRRLHQVDIDFNKILLAIEDLTDKPC